MSNVGSKLSDPSLIDVRERHLARMERLFAGEPLDRPFFLLGLSGQPQVSVMDDPAACAAQAAAKLAEQASRSLDEHVFRPLVLEQWVGGVHFIDALFGARVYFSDGQWWNDFLSQPVGRLEMPDLDTQEYWLKARRFTETCVALDAQAVFLCPQVLSSPLNIIVNLYGQAVLEAMAADPVAVRRDLRVITDLILELHRRFTALIPAGQFQPVSATGRCQPRGFGQICGCTTHLLSADMYRELIAPLDDEILSFYPHGGMIHLCGAHTQHIPTWRAIKSFRAFQINDRAAEDLESYFHGLRDDQVIYLNPTATMTIERALEITGGRRVVIVAEPPATRPERKVLKPENAQ